MQISDQNKPVKTVYLIAGWSFRSTMWAAWLDGVAAGATPAVRLVPLDAASFARWMLSDDSQGPDGARLTPGAYAALGWSLGGGLLVESMIRGRWQPSPAWIVSASPRFLADPVTGWSGIMPAALNALRAQTRKNPVSALARFDAWLGLPPMNASRETDPLILSEGLGWLAQLDHRAVAAELPLRWICGREDPLVPVPEQLPAAALILPAAGHGLPFSHFDYLLTALNTHD